MGLFDQIIEPFSPAWALKRARSRMALEITRSYEAAGHDRRTKGWRTSPSSATVEVGTSLGRVRDRARALVRDDGYAKRAKRVWRSNTVGEGIKPGGDEKLIELWEDWAIECDQDGLCDFYGLESLLSGTVYESGECLVRYIFHKSRPDLVLPLQIQLLEPDHLDTDKIEDLGDGNIVIQGVEFDKMGRRITYWIFATHPGDAFVGFGSSLKSQRVPADEIDLIFWIDRPGQIRGISEMAAVILKLRDLGDYEDAELVRKKIEACFAAFVTSDDGPDGSPLSETDKENSGRLVEKLVPGLIKYLRPGEDVSFATPSSSGGHGDYIRQQLHGIAAGLSVTYQQLTGDLSQANYASMRGGLIEFRKPVKEFQKQVIIHQFCRGAERRFVLAALLVGEIKKKPKHMKWTPPAFEAVDPLKDVLADVAAVRGGLKTLHAAIAERGGDPAKHIKELEGIAKALDDAELVLDTDPRKTAKSGIVQDITKLIGDG